MESPLIYSLEVEINLVELDPKYPKEPKTLGERIRKARMDQHLMVKELAQQVGVVPETVINWEKRNLKLTRSHRERLQAVLGLDGEVGGSSQGERQSQS